MASANVHGNWRAGLNRRLFAAAVCGLLAACVAPARQPDAVAEPSAVWVQADASGGWSVRALTAAPQCPTLSWQQGEVLMQTRAAPGEVAPRLDGAQPESKTAVFTKRSCEAPWPAAAAAIQIGARRIQRPAPMLRHIVLIGDSGCRLKASESAFQGCNDASRWPFAAIAERAAAGAPDLVIHLGDLHYRESPCPASRPDCAGSPWGYGQDTWEADLFQPAAALLAAAPWVFVRGNHESCSRAGVGWFRYLDARARLPKGNCERPQDDAASEFTEPYVVALSADTQLIVFDSSFAAAKAYPADHPVALRYAAQLRRVAELAQTKPHNFFLNHHPVLAYGGSDSGQPKPGHAGLLSVMATVHPQRLYAAGVDVVLNGHVHLFEALGFASGHPATLVMGNAGSMMEGHVDAAAALRQQPAPGARVQVYATQPGFGYATLDREGEGWLLTEHDPGGRPLTTCQLRGSWLGCSAAGP